jgi:hypothetical protein
MVPGLPPRTRGPVEDLVRGAFGGGTRIVSVEDVGGRRAELATHLPAANDPVIFGHALTDAAALWVARDMTAGLLAGALKKDQKWGISTWRQRMIHRLPAFIELAHRHDHLPAFAETAESLHRRLTGKWVKLTPMPTYPALR